MEIDFKYLALSARKNLPETEAIYFVLCRNNVLYIGTTTNLKSRFHRHHLRYCFSRFKNPYIMWFWKKDSNLELHLIKTFRPLFNQRDLNGLQEKNEYYYLFKKHLMLKYVSVENLSDSRIINVRGAMKILGISRTTLAGWQEEGFLKSFKTVYNGRLRKCYQVSELEKLAGQGDPIST